MYIRTECGVLGKLKHIKLNMYEFNNERYIKNGIRLHNSNHDYTIKMQEKKHIDILEKNDLLICKIYGDKHLVELINNEYIKITNREKIHKSNASVKHFNVLTHEQCEPLWQEVL